MTYLLILLILNILGRLEKKGVLEKMNFLWKYNFCKDLSYENIRDFSKYFQEITYQKNDFLFENESAIIKK